ncbi:HAD family hydrolase [Catenuloplanes atrovinosus]|uniref:Hydrolase of the HAD superfamily n=1 Tax=Catenuloplanes atrovinosus TaxID=137266 RepID=A0AAE3YYL0_9ACTN|nr:HAD family hydrolase [Catenuloplanes atrovinosus]MDR7280584.1 putative hydrolase of the HAD superfamily [Catenuloplanes atrovinosus]
MPAYRAVLFDFFGTLTRAVRRGPAHAGIARMLGCDPATMVDVLDRSYHARARGMFGSAEDTLRWVAAEAGAHPGDPALRAAVDARREAIHADTTLRPEAVPTLRALRRRGLRTAVVSDCTHELPDVLPRLPVNRLLDARVLSVELGVCKPDPGMFLCAAALVGARPEECLYVGDGGSRELSGAEAVGMTAVRLRAPDLAGHLTFNPDTTWTGPDITGLEDTIALVDRVLEPA